MLDRGAELDRRHTSCTRPMCLARRASKRSPVRKSARACDAPIFARTNGEITAGMMAELDLGESEDSRRLPRCDVADGREAGASSERRAVI